MDEGDIQVVRNRRGALHAYPAMVFLCEPRLFHPFMQINQARIEGHGLGLSIVRRIVERLGGEVGMESRKGKGSTFFFTLRKAEG